MRDASLKLNYLELMRRANDKMDAIEKAAVVSQSEKTSTKDTTLQAKLEALEKKTKSLHSGKKGSKSKGGSKDGGKGKASDKKGGHRFPSELRKKPAPADHTKPHTTDGVDYYYCFTWNPVLQDTQPGAHQESPSLKRALLLSLFRLFRLLYRQF
jgi:hypothetical protein